MKKTLILILSFVTLSFMMVNFAHANVSEEQFTYKEIAVEVAKNQGDGITGSLADYTLKKGRVEGTLEKFTETSYNEENETLLLGNTSDDIYADDWRTFTKNNQGLVYEVIAKDSVSVSFVKDRNDIGWIDDTTLKIYKKDVNNNLEMVVKRDLSNGGPLSDLEYSIDLEAGETVYYEFVFEWEPYRNLQQPPTVVTVLKGVVYPVDVSSEGNISAKDLNLNTAIFEGEDTQTYQYADFGVRTGSKATTLSKFSSWEIDNNNKTAQLGLDTQDAYVDANYIYTKNNVGITYVISAKDDIVIEATKPLLEGDLSNTKVQIYVNNDLHKEYDLDEEESLFDEIIIDDQDILYYQVISSGNTFDKVNLDLTFKVKKYTGKLGDPYDFSDLEEITTIEAVDQLVRLQGENIIMKDIEMNILQGQVTGKINKFNYYTYVAEPLNYELTSKEYTFDGEEGAAVQTWRMKTTLNSHVVFVFEAKENLKLTIGHDPVNSGWIDNNREYIGLYLLSRDNLFTISEQYLTSAVHEADALGGELNMKAGDTAYWVFGSEEALQANLQIITKVTTSTADFDEAAYNDTTTLTKEKVNMWDALTGVINNNYLDKEYVLFNLGFYQGDVYEEISLFDYHVGDGSGTADDSLWDNEAEKTGFRRWQIEANPGNNAIMKFTAKANMTVTVKHTPVWEDAWSIHTGVRYVVENDEGLMITVNEMFVQPNTDEDHFGIVLHLRENETLYVEYFAKGQWGSLNFAPSFNVDTDTFDESEATDFDYLRQVNNLKLQKISDLEDYINGLVSEEYRVSAWAEINDYLENMSLELRSAKTIEEVNQIYNNALTSIQSVKTILQLEEELNTYKLSKVNELKDYVNNELDKKNYTKKDWNSILEKLDEFEEAVESLTVKAQIDVQFTMFKTSINNVPTKSPTSPVVWISISSALVLLLGGLGFILIIKRKK